MAVETYGVDATVMSAYMAQIGFDTLAPVTPTRLAQLVSHAASRLNGILITASGSDSVITAIAADTASVAYANMQGLVCVCVAPAVYASAYSTHGDAAHRSLTDACRAELDAFRRNPKTIGITTAGILPEVRTSTADYAIAPATTKVAREYDDIGGDFEW